METHRRNTYSCNVSIVSVIFGIIFGALIGVLSYFGYLPAITNGVLVAAIVAAIALILFWISVVLRKYCSEDECICENYRALLIGIFGTLIAAFIAFSAALAAFSIIYAVLVGLVAFFFILTIAGIIGYLVCKADCDCGCDCDCDIR